jgi:phosphoribosylglycinamide formyltransferase-1
MRIGIITYDARHLKTEQVALALHHRGRYEMLFFGLPFVQRPARTIVFAHRPNMEQGASSRDVARSVGGEFIAVESINAVPPDACKLFLIAGAGLLAEEWVNRTAGRVINSHPGIIPLVRGLDAFNWAILDGMPLGNTLHFIDAEADAGQVIARVATPVFASDDLVNLARRHYELEIQMMVDFETHLERRATAAPDVANYEVRPARMRMKAEQQMQLHDAFADYRARYAEV